MSSLGILLCTVAGLSIAAWSFGCRNKGDRPGAGAEEGPSPIIVVHTDEGAASRPTPEEPARSASEGDTQEQLEEARVLLEDFVHYVAIAYPKGAATAYQALRDSGVSNLDLAILIDVEMSRSLQLRFETALRFASRYPELERIAEEFTVRVELGRNELEQRAP